MAEKMGLCGSFFSLKHIKNLYLSSFLTQKSNFQSLPLSKTFYNIFIEPIVLSIGEGQSWFGKWLELPWYWCVRVELSLQHSARRRGVWEHSDKSNIIQESSLPVLLTWIDEKDSSEVLTFCCFKCASFISWNLLFWIATFSQCECNESVS